MSFTYPFLIKELIETKLHIKANLFLRGGGGADIEFIKNALMRDSLYFGGDGKVISIVVLQFGIVDCAPRPITYLFLPILQRLPIVGSKILKVLSNYRTQIQNIWNYRFTPPKKFLKEYKSIVDICKTLKLLPISIGLPLPTISIDERSPGFRNSVGVYNELIKDIMPDKYCDIEQHISEATRDMILLPDGHHLTPKGHELYAEVIFDTISNKILAKCNYA
jgi:hypothetical protein